MTCSTLYICVLQVRSFSEKNCSTQSYGNVPIIEPCDYASNIAYYHSAVEFYKKKDWSFTAEEGRQNPKKTSH